MTTIAFFDPSGTGHSDNALVGLAAAARGAGLDVSVFAPERARKLERPAGIEWVTVDVAPELKSVRDQWAHGAALRRALSSEHDIFWDLGLDRTARSRGSIARVDSRTVFTLHRTGAFDAAPGVRREEAYLARNRARVGALAARGAGFVVHTKTVRERLATWVPAGQIELVGWPVVSAGAASLTPEWRSPRPDRERVVLFAGSTRQPKGLGLLLDAARDVAEFDRLVVPGVVPGWLRRTLDLSDPRVDVWNRWLTADEYRSAIDGASVVALPYAANYCERGTISAALLDALASGRPTVVSSAIVHLLPDGYRGAVPFEAESRAALSAALRAALGDLDNLERESMGRGREFIAEHHTYEGYVGRVLARAGLAA